VYRGQPPANVAELEERIVRAWDRLPLDDIRRAIDAVPDLMLLCEEHRGDQIVGFQ
jgi:hypothetical protein